MEAIYSEMKRRRIVLNGMEFSQDWLGLSKNGFYNIDGRKGGALAARARLYQRLLDAGHLDLAEMALADLLAASRESDDKQ